MPAVVVVRAHKGETLTTRLIPGPWAAFLNLDVANEVIHQGHGLLIGWWWSPV